LLLLLLVVVAAAAAVVVMVVVFVAVAVVEVAAAVVMVVVVVLFHVERWSACPPPPPSPSAPHSVSPRLYMNNTLFHCFCCAIVSTPPVEPGPCFMRPNYVVSSVAKAVSAVSAGPTSDGSNRSAAAAAASDHFYDSIQALPLPVILGSDGQRCVGCLR
jgi:hypothetical protein